MDLERYMIWSDLTSPDAKQSLEARDHARDKETGVDDLSCHQRVGGAHGRQQNERDGDDSSERRQEMLEYKRVNFQSMAF